MEFKNFDELLRAAGGRQKPSRAVIANAGDAHVMDFLRLAESKGLPRPVLVGVAADIKALLQSNDLPGDYVIYDCCKEDAAQRAVEIVKAGEGDFLMKGMLETSDFLRPIVKRENDLRTESIMSYQAFLSLPSYHKLLLCTDGGMVAYPTLEQKKKIVSNAVRTLHCFGYDLPKAAVLCCKETVDSKMPETLDAAELHQAALNGDFGAAAVDGPLSYDICMRADIAKSKHFECEHSGNYDILVFPNIHAGNILVKSLIINGGAVSAGIIAGCKVPVVAPSRGATPEEQLLSAAVAAVIAEGGSR